MSRRKKKAVLELTRLGVSDRVDEIRDSNPAISNKIYEIGKGESYVRNL